MARASSSSSSYPPPPSIYASEAHHFLEDVAAQAPSPLLRTPLKYALYMTHPGGTPRFRAQCVLAAWLQLYVGTALLWYVPQQEDRPTWHGTTRGSGLMPQTPSSLAALSSLDTTCQDIKNWISTWGTRPEVTSPSFHYDVYTALLAHGHLDEDPAPSTAALHPAASALVQLLPPPRGDVAACMDAGAAQSVTAHLAQTLLHELLST